MPHQRALRWREVSLPRRAPVVGHASCGLQRQANAACVLRSACRRRLSLGRRRSTLACCARAPCRARCGWPMPHTRAMRWQKASLLRRAQGEGAALELAVRARHAAPVLVGLCPAKGHCAGERPFSFGARQWCDVPDSTTNAKPAPLVTWRTRAGAHCLWRGGAALELALRARHAALIVVGSYHMKGHRAGERPLSFDARPWCNAPAAASDAKPAPLVSRSARVPALAVSGGGGAALELALRARHAALVMIGSCHIKGHRADERPLSFSARPWCDVPAAVSNAKRAPRV